MYQIKMIELDNFTEWKMSEMNSMICVKYQIEKKIQNAQIKAQQHELICEKNTR